MLAILNKLIPTLTLLCLVMLPLGLLKRMREFSGSILLGASWVFGAATWLFGFLYTYAVWGLGPVILGPAWGLAE